MIMDINELEEILKSYFESMYSKGDFIAWLNEEATNPLAMSYNNEAKELLTLYKLKEA